MLHRLLEVITLKNQLCLLQSQLLQSQFLWLEKEHPHRSKPRAHKTRRGKERVRPCIVIQCAFWLIYIRSSPIQASSRGCFQALSDLALPCTCTCNFMHSYMYIVHAHVDSTCTCTCTCIHVHVQILMHAQHVHSLVPRPSPARAT